MRRDLIIAGLALILGGTILTVVLGPFGPLNEFASLFELLGFIGLILLIVGVIKSGSGGGAPMQQQQQVVVMAPPPGYAPPAPAAPSAPRLRCPTCKSLNDADARFCRECGHPIPAAGAPPKPAARPARKR